MRKRSALFLTMALSPALGAIAASLGACGQGSAAPPSSPTDSGAPADHAVRLDAPIHPDAACAVTIDSPPILPGSHVSLGTDVPYDSNPPSSGPHYPVWAAFQEFTTPVDRRYYVHDLEHGAVVFLYRCDDAGGCPAVVAAFKAASDAIPTDPLCDADAGLRVRTVITPDPLIDVPIAAAAWGWTYKADCLDLSSLKQFAVDHYAQGTENFCSNGQTTF